MVTTNWVRLSGWFFTNISDDVHDMELILPPVDHVNTVKGISCALYPVNRKDYLWHRKETLTVSRFARERGRGHPRSRRTRLRKDVF
jgi:hypothetical protein